MGSDVESEKRMDPGTDPWGTPVTRWWALENLSSTGYPERFSSELMLKPVVQSSSNIQKRESE